MLEIVKKRKWLFIIAGVVVAGFVWYSLSSGDVPDTALTSQNLQGGGDTAIERELVNSLLELRSIRLDGQIFSDPAFASLRDEGTEIVPEPVGRRNPFAPLSASAAASSEEE